MNSVVTHVVFTYILTQTHYSFRIQSRMNEATPGGVSQVDAPPIMKLLSTPLIMTL